MTRRQQLQQRQRKSGSLPGTGLRAGENVAACENYRDGLLLYWGRFCVTFVGNSSDQLGTKAERFKCSANGYLLTKPAEAQRAFRTGSGRIEQS